jgi:PTH1 family peptidyl-tRNA hydrolase
MSRFLLLGLGNPGDQYTNTRHNAGWMAIDWLIEKWADPSIPVQWKHEKKIQAEVARFHFARHEIFAIKPQTFMNRSGETARAAVEWYLDLDLETESNSDLPELLLLHDDLDIETGRYKLQKASGPKVHNGVNSVRDHLKTPHFWYARLGVDSRAGDRRIPGEAYVLQRFSPEEKQLLKQATSALAEELFYTVLQ